MTNDRPIQEVDQAWKELYGGLFRSSSNFQGSNEF